MLRRPDVSELTPRPDPASHRVRLISANWKMNINHLEAIAYVQKLHQLLRVEDYRFAEISIHCPFTDLRSLQLSFDADSMAFRLGAQNCFNEESGAHTGEIAPSMLAKLGVYYVIVGHSERRSIESSEFVASKAAAAFSAGLIPLVCVGETREEHDAGRSEEVVREELAPVLSVLTSTQAARCVFAYEPIWAIGTGISATPEDAAQMAAYIRSYVGDVCGSAAAEGARIQYGGSVSIGNGRDFMSAPDVDGLLIGSASLDAQSFARLIQAL